MRRLDEQDQLRTSQLQGGRQICSQFAGNHRFNGQQLTERF